MVSRMVRIAWSRSRISASRVVQRRAMVTSARFAQDPIHQLLFPGTNQFGFHERVFFYERIEQRLRRIDRHRCVPDKLTFFFCSFDESRLGLGVQAGYNG